MRKSLPESTKTAISHSSSMSNKKPPGFLIKPQSQHLQIGSKLQLRAQIHSTSPMRSVTWFKNSCFIDEEDGYKEYNINDEYYLECNQVNIDHSGNYKISACNKCGEASASADIHVNNYGNAHQQQQPSRISSASPKPYQNPHTVSHSNSMQKEISRQTHKSGGETISASSMSESREIQPSYHPSQENQKSYQSQSNHSQNFQQRIYKKSYTSQSQSSNDYQKVVTQTQGQSKPMPAQQNVPCKFTQQLDERTLNSTDYLMLEAFYQGYPDPKVFWIAEAICRGVKKF